MTGARGIKKESIVSLRVGATRRQATCSTRVPHRFPQSIGRQPMKIEIFERVAHARLVLDPAEVSWSIPLETVADVKAVGAAGLQVAGTSARGATCDSGPRLDFRIGGPADTGAGGNTDPASIAGTQPEINESAAAATVVADTISSPFLSRHCSSSVELYMKEHGITNIMETLLQALVKDRPHDPYQYMIGILQNSRTSALTGHAPPDIATGTHIDAPAAPELPVPAALPVNEEQLPSSRTPAQPLARAARGVVPEPNDRPPRLGGSASAPVLLQNGSTPVRHSSMAPSPAGTPLMRPPSAGIGRHSTDSCPSPAAPTRKVTASLRAAPGAKGHDELDTWTPPMLMVGIGLHGTAFYAGISAEGSRRPWSAHPGRHRASQRRALGASSSDDYSENNLHSHIEDLPEDEELSTNFENTLQSLCEMVREDEDEATESGVTSARTLVCEKPSIGDNEAT